MLTKPDAAQVSRLPDYIKATRDVVYRREIAYVVGVVDADSIAVCALRGYDKLYPQAFAFDDVSNELWILRTKVSGGTDSWAWITVYDLDTLAIKTTFTTGQNWSESLIIRWSGGVRYMHTIGDSNSVISCNVTTLPARLSVMSGVTPSGITGYTQMAFDGRYFIVQDVTPYQGYSRRNRFTLYYDDFTVLGKLELPLDACGDFGSYLERLPKSQGIAAYKGLIVMGCGSDWVTGVHNPQWPYLQHGIQGFTYDGAKQFAGLSRPDLDLEIWNANLGYVANMVECEGVAVHDDGVYALWMTVTPDLALGAPTTYAGKGIVITRELSTAYDAVDFARAATVTRSFDVTKLNASVLNNFDAAIRNPITNAVIGSFAGIVELMRNTGLSRYAFAGSGQTILDLNGATVPVAGGLVVATALGGNSYFVEVISATPANCRAYWLTTNGTVQIDLTAPRRFVLGGAGTPEGAVAAEVGATYHRTDGAAGTCFYVKESGTGNTGWVAK